MVESVGTEAMTYNKVPGVQGSYGNCVIEATEQANQRKWNRGKMCHRKVFGVSEQIIVEVEAFKVHIK